MRVTAGVLLAGAVIASAHNTKSNRNWESSYDVYRRQNNIATAFFVHAATVDATRLAEYSWEDLGSEIFQGGFLAPGATASGRFFFPNQSYFKFIRLVIPIDGNDYVFDFKKKPKPHPEQL